MSDNNTNFRNNPPRRGPGVPGEKPKNFGPTIKKLAVYCRAYMVPIFIAIILACTGAIFNIIGPDKLGEITDLITEGIMIGIDIKAVEKVAVLLVVLYGLGWIFNYVQSVTMAIVTQKTTQRLRRQISQKINRLPLKYFDSTSFGDVLSRVTNDVDMIGMTLNNSIGNLVIAVTTFIGALIMMFVTNWIMALAGIAATLIGFVFMTTIMGRSQKYFIAQQKELGNINGHIEEIFSGHTVVKAYSGEQKAKDEFDTINGRLYTDAWKSQFMSGLMMPIMGFIGNLGYVVVCIVGAVLAQKGIISFGVIVSFMVYIRIFTQPLSQMAQIATNMQSAAAAAERVFEFLEAKEMAPERDDVVELKNARGNVSFKNITFGYNPDKMIIKNFSVEAKAGQKIAIVGPTGAGKTTLVNLLMRFYEVNEGEILIDGVPINRLTRENIHDLFGMVLQDTWMFEGTIRENIVYSKEGVSDEDLDRVCKAVGLHHLIRTLPKGYDTIMNDKANLSAGQKQLVTIARAMIENAPMIILDEATSSVDTRTELQIQKAMDELMKGRTSFIIAHRLSTIKNADLILVVKDGNIVEMGKHQELLAENGFYAELYNSQFER